MTIDSGLGLELGAQRFGGGAGILRFEQGVKFGGDFEEFPVARLPDFEERPRVEPPGHGAAPVELFLESLADQVFFQALAACVFEDADEPQQFLAIEAGERTLGSRHEL